MYRFYTLCYTIDFVAKKQMIKAISFMMRMEKDLHEQLKKEAAADGRSIAGYIRHLVRTHQDRKKKT